MRPQRPASASPYVNTTTGGGARPFHSRPATPAEDAVHGGGKRDGGVARQVKLSSSSGGGDGSEVAALQDQLRAALQRQAEVDENHQRDATAFRHRLRRLHNDNAGLRNIIAAAESRKRNGDRPVSGTVNGGAASVTEAECEALQYRINVAIRKLNQMQHDIAKEEGRMRQISEAEDMATVQLHSLLDKELFAGGNASVVLRMQKMERKLDAVLLQQNSVGVVLRGYEHHLRELTEEARHYDGRMQHLENEYTARHRDHMQLVSLFQNAQDDYRRASEEREGLLRTLRRLRSAKEKALGDKSSEVTTALRETQRREQHLTDLQQQLDEEVQHLEYAEHVHQQLDQRRHLSRTVNDIVREPSTTSGAYHEAGGSGDGALTAEEGERLVAYEKAFRAMMQAARVDKMEDLITAFENEHASHDHLAQQVADARAAHDALAEEVKRLHHRHEEAGGAIINARRRVPASAASGKLLAELRSFVREEQAELQRQISANEADAALLLEVARRVDAIASKTAAYRPDVYIPADAEESLLAATRSGEGGAGGATAGKSGRANLLAHVLVLKQKLFALADDATRVATATAAAGPGPGPGAHAGALVRSTQVIIPENNVRVNFDKKPVVAAAGIGPKRAYLQLQQQQQQRQSSASRSWLDDSADTPFPMANHREGQRDSLFADNDAEDDDDPALLLSNATMDDEGGQHHHHHPLACTGSSSRNAEDDGNPHLPDSGAGGGKGPAEAAGDEEAAANTSDRGPYEQNRNDDPLNRAEVKQMSAAIELRERRRLDRERLNTTAAGRS